MNVSALHGNRDLVRAFCTCAILSAATFMALTAAAELVELNTDVSSCVVETVGARVLSFRGPDGKETLWNADPMQQTDDKWVHGGIPVCWPWFGVNGKGDFHGTAWRRPFTVVSRQVGKDRCELVLACEEGDVRLEYAIVLRDSLTLELRTTNCGSKDIALSLGFHPYFHVGERDQVEVGGLADKPISIAQAMDVAYPGQKGSCSVCQIHDKSLNRSVLLNYENVDGINLWNPGEMNDCPGTLPADAWRKFVCVEPVLGADKPIRLGSGCSTLLKMGIEVAKGCVGSGFAGEDPRYPGFADKNFSLPFKVMFIGAHPDDADYQFGATATKLVKAGARVVFVSVCNGDNGHETMDPQVLAARRYLETQAAAKVYGVERYVVMGEHDCLVEPSVDLRKRVTRLIRQFAPHLVVTHRTCDYHADHRATGQVVQDATYLMGVPLFCSDTPVPETLPFVMYAGDRFTLPRPFRPDMMVLGDDVIDRTLEALCCHESQLFEWLPPEYGIDPKTIPTGKAERFEFLKKNLPTDLYLNGELHRDLVDRTFPGKNAKYVDAFELCEYARQPSQKEIDYLVSLGFKWLRK